MQKHGNNCENCIKYLDLFFHRSGENTFKAKLSLGAFRTYPADSLFFEANEPPLVIRRFKLTLPYICETHSKYR